MESFISKSYFHPWRGAKAHGKLRVTFTSRRHLFLSNLQILMLLTFGSIGQTKLCGMREVKMTPFADVTSKGTTSLSADVRASIIYRGSGSEVIEMDCCQHS